MDRNRSAGLNGFDVSVGCYDRSAARKRKRLRHLRPLADLNGKIALSDCNCRDSDILTYDHGPAAGIHHHPRRRVWLNVKLSDFSDETGGLCAWWPVQLNRPLILLMRQAHPVTAIVKALIASAIRTDVLKSGLFKTSVSGPMLRNCPGTSLSITAPPGIRPDVATFWVTVSACPETAKPATATCP
jgi:hypothetical protein